MNLLTFDPSPSVELAKANNNVLTLPLGTTSIKLYECTIDDSLSATLLGLESHMVTLYTEFHGYS